MKIDHQFTIAAPLDRVWAVMADPERCVTSLPGASLDTLDGDAFTGKIAVKLGPMSLSYKGEGKLSREPALHRIQIEGRGVEQRGAGTAAATIAVELRAVADGQTSAAVSIDLDLAGKPAQFGRGILAEVVVRLAATFVQRLEQQLAAEETGVAATTRAGDEPDDAINVLDLGRAVLIRQAAPIAGIAAATMVVVLVVRRWRLAVAGRD